MKIHLIFMPLISVRREKAFFPPFSVEEIHNCGKNENKKCMNG
jgi:hypothetical protein